MFYCKLHLILFISILFVGCGKKEEVDNEYFTNRVVINEITSRKALEVGIDDSIELFNGKIYEVNLAGWRLKNSQGKTFEFTEEDYIPPLSYLVVSKKKHKLKLTKIGSIKLKNDTGVTIDYVEWKDGMAQKNSLCRIPNLNGPFIPCIIDSFKNNNQAIRINHIKEGDQEGHTFSIELINMGAPISIYGWVLSNKKGDTFVIQRKEVLATRERLLLGNLVQEDFTISNHQLKLKRKDRVELSDNNGKRIDKVKWKKDQLLTGLCRSPFFYGKFSPCIEDQTK
ncbi:MAG: hypothetical protein HON90_15980 [Halobacteriovoraceae bacterium]|jgi:hypothetical protein|nr:hypothetical protein [Halobacteriovoraceae bacterium]